MRVSVCSIYSKRLAQCHGDDVSGAIVKRWHCESVEMNLRKNGWWWKRSSLDVVVVIVIIHFFTMMIFTFLSHFTPFFHRAGVSCDFCMKSNFRGRRYKCLICFDYDLCAECYESNATSTRHTTEHAVQCILTRSMLEVAYGSGSSSRQFQSFTCPYCSKKGFSDTTLLEHVTAEHSESSESTDGAVEVICPVCAASPGGEPNLKTDDLAEHLTLEHHRGGSGSTFEFINEPSAIRHGGVRRISRAAVGPGGVRSARRSNPNFSPSNQEPADRESVDLFAELQQTLAGGSRRQLQQLQMQIQMERQAIENRITNISRRPAGSTTSGTGTSSANQASISIQRILSAMSNSGNARAESFMSSSPAARSQLLASVASGGGGAVSSSTHTSSSTGSSQLSFIPAGIQLQGLQAAQANDAGSIQVPTVGGQFLMPRFLAPAKSEDDREQLERERSDRWVFVQSHWITLIKFSSF